MKKTIISLILLAVTCTMMAEVSSYVIMKVSDVNNNNDVISIYEDASEFTTDFDNDGDATDQPNTGNYGLNLYSEQAWGNASIVAIDDIYTVKVTFESNDYEANYTITFTDVLGEGMFLKDTKVKSVVNPSKDSLTAIVINGTYAFSQAVNTTESNRFEIVSNELPFHPRETMTAGNWGTICYKEAITAVEGATIYEFAGRTATQVAADPVTLPTVAGTAYLFLTTADGPKFYYEELGTMTTPIDNNGLVGKFEQYTTTETEAYVIKGQSLVPAAVGSTVPANRAFVPVLSDIPALSQAPARAGRLFFNVANTPTGLDMIEAADMKDGKMMIDGQLVIIRDGKMFNAQGMEL